MCRVLGICAQGLVLTDAMQTLSTRVLDAYKHAQPLLLEGDAASGKTAAVAFCGACGKERTPEPGARGLPW